MKSTKECFIFLEVNVNIIDSETFFLVKRFNYRIFIKVYMNASTFDVSPCQAIDQLILLIKYLTF